MIPDKLKYLIEKHCMGRSPSNAEMQEILDLMRDLGLNDNEKKEVRNYMTGLMRGQTREQMEAERQAEVERQAEKANSFGSIQHPKLKNS